MMVNDIQKYKISDNAFRYGFNSYIDFYNASKFVENNKIKMNFTPPLLSNI